MGFTAGKMTVAKRDRFFLLFLALFSGLFLFWQLGSTYLTNWDEAWYAGISRNMLLRHDFIVPYWNGSLYLDKGPLYHWLTVIFYQFFPRWELAARIPAALAGLGCILLVYKLGKELFNEKVGLVAGMVLLSTVGFLYRSRTGNLDSLSGFFVVLSYLAYFHAAKARKYYLLAGLALGFLYLVKSGLVPKPLFVLLSLFLLKPKLAIFKNYTFLIGIFMGILLVGFWLLLGMREEGKVFLNFYLNPLFWPFFKFGETNHAIDRFSLNYVSFLFYGMKLWFLALIPAFFYVSWRAFKEKRFFFLLIAFLPYFLVLLLTKDAGDWYLVPLYPITALVVAVFLVAVQEKYLPGKRWTQSLIIGCFLLAVGQLLYFHQLFIVPESVANEVTLAKTAKNLSNSSEILVVDDYYFPVASFYSERKIKVVRRQATDNQLAWSQASYYQYLRQENPRTLILTTPDNLKTTRADLGGLNFKVIMDLGGHLLVSQER